MGRTGKILCGIRSYAVDSLCTACRNEPFILDCCRNIGYMGVWDACFMGKQTKGIWTKI